MITRFAPSPTGPLHLGHAYSAILAHDMARAAGGWFLLRIEDIDQSRARPEWEAALIDDLTWLGLVWDGPILRQSTRQADYDAALDKLAAQGLLYPCHCARRDIEAAASAPQEGAPTHGPDGRIYPGTCRNRPFAQAARDHAIRLNLAQAVAQCPPEGVILETGPRHAGQHRLDGADMIATIGDPVLARPKMGVAYHLAVVVDDAAQGVTHVTRGEDLFEATRLHAYLGQLLNLPRPVWHHHALIRDEAGKRLAKRDDARALARYRADGASPADIRAMVGLPHQGAG